MAVTTTSLGILLLAAFLPPVIWMVVLRNTERYGREPAGRVLRAFLWGAVVAVIVALVLSLVFLLVLEGTIAPVYQFLGERGFADPVTLIAVVVVAPFVEEFAKALGVLRVRRFIAEPEDGLVYGGSAGLGFAATENLFYGLAVLLASDGSLGASLLLIGIRSVSSAFLHATATASTGYGIAKRKVWGESALPWYLLAVALHASFNFLASLGAQMSATLGEGAALIGLVAAIAFGLLGFALIRKKIREKDAPWPS